MDPIVVKTDKIPVEKIDPDALKVIRRLRRHGHVAYLVGGCVRDLLNGLTPKDFDVITSARPRQVRRLFSNSRVIGRRFRLVHVIFGENVIEVSTFRADPGQPEGDEDGDSPETTALEGEREDGAAVDDLDDLDADDLEDGDDADDSDDLEDGDDADDADPEADDADDADLEAEEDDDDDASDDDDLDADDSNETEDEGRAGPDDAATADDEDREDDEDRAGASASESDREPEELAVSRSARSRRSSRRRRSVDDEDDEDESGRDDDRGGDVDEFEKNNLFGGPEEDARRRDFTINALFYDPDEQEIIDYAGGLQDIERRLINPINDPDVAFVEDPVRMIRAMRFAAKLGYDIEAGALAATERHRYLIGETSQRRLLEEIFKILKSEHARECMQLLVRTRTAEYFLPEIDQWIREDQLGAPSAPEADAEPALTSARVPRAPAGAEGPPAAVEPAAAGSTTAAATPESGPESAPESALESVPESGPASRAVTNGDEQGAALESPKPASAPSGEVATAVESQAEAASSGEDEPSGRPEQDDSAEEDPREGWGRTVTLPVDPPLYLYPQDSWQPDQRMVDAYLRVTWERPHPEGANDWVEDPHVFIQDAVFEAAAFARDAYLEEVGLAAEARLASERARAESVLKVLRWNGRLEEIVASFPDDEAPARRRRRRRSKEREEEPAPPEALEAPLPQTLSRLDLLLGYLGALDKLNSKEVPLSTGLRLSVLFGPMLLTHLDQRLRAQSSEQAAEEIADELLFPIARRQSLARKDRDRIKRCGITLWRLLTGELRRRKRGQDRLLAREHVREAIVLMYLHCKATGLGWDDFRYWEGRAKQVKAEAEEEPSRGRGGRGGGAGGRGRKRGQRARGGRSRGR